MPNSSTALVPDNKVSVRLPPLGRNLWTIAGLDPVSVRGGVSVHVRFEYAGASVTVRPTQHLRGCSSFARDTRSDTRSATNPCRHAWHGGPRVANLHFQSGMTEITLSPDLREARVSWSWFAPRNYSSIYNGDADTLPNRNVLGTFPQGIALLEVVPPCCAPRHV